MPEITIPTEGLDEAISGLDEGGSVEIHATLKVIAKSDSEMTVEVSDVKPCQMDDDVEVEDDDGSEYGGEAVDSSCHPGGVLIMLGAHKPRK
jgi:hypothetical protein